MRKPRAQMIAETRAKLIAAARAAFGTVGYAETSMDDLTASARYFNGRAASIYGGSNEIQRNIMAKLMLGL